MEETPVDHTSEEVRRRMASEGGKHHTDGLPRLPRVAPATEDVKEREKSHALFPHTASALRNVCGGAFFHLAIFVTSNDPLFVQVALLVVTLSSFWSHFAPNSKRADRFSTFTVVYLLNMALCSVRGWRHILGGWGALSFCYGIPRLVERWTGLRPRRVRRIAWFVACTIDIRARYSYHGLTASLTSFILALAAFGAHRLLRQPVGDNTRHYRMHWLSHFVTAAQLQCALSWVA